MQSLIALINTEENCVNAALQATLACAFNAMPVTEAVCVLHSVLTRSINSGLLSICGCFIQALNVPIIPIEKLCDFFKSDEVSVFKVARLQFAV